MEGPEPDLLQDLSAAIPKAALVPSVQAVLGVTRSQAERIVQAFDDFVASPMEAKLANTRAYDLAKRNPMIYTTRGVTTVDEWVDRVLEDKETSAVETHLGTWTSRVLGSGEGPGLHVKFAGSDEQIEWKIGDCWPVLWQVALSGSALTLKGDALAEDEIKTHPADLELTPENADDVKGGLLPTEPGTEGRGLAVHKSKHTSHKGPSGPTRGMPHE